MRRTKEQKRIDDQVHEILKRALNNNPIDIMKIGKVSEFARNQLAIGADMEVATANTIKLVLELGAAVRHV